MAQYGTLAEQLKEYLRQSNVILNKKSIGKQDRQDLQDIIDYLCTEYIGMNAAFNYVDEEFRKTVGDRAYYNQVSIGRIAELTREAQAGLMLDDEEPIKVDSVEV